ncbi:hypothetical protein, partial [Clostridium lacusfryxellense]|uniref:hypothetical protein n=1 Tax=Clostridium lacusfryxellense TaxID=205328 RepID=UPI001C0C5276
FDIKILLLTIFDNHLSQLLPRKSILYSVYTKLFTGPIYIFSIDLHMSSSTGIPNSKFLFLVFNVLSPG